MTHTAQLGSRFATKFPARLGRPRAVAIIAASGPTSGRAPAVERLEDRTLFALAVTPYIGSTPPATLAAELLLGGNTGITITGATFTGSAPQAGTYSGFDLRSGQNRLAISDGVLLTSGSALGAQGPNENRFPGQAGSSEETTSVGSPGDPLLTALVGVPTQDANALEITFTVDPSVKSILFDFVFGSEEFPNFVGSFNDAFGAFLDGVQVSFDPDGTPITVNNNFFLLNNSGLAAGDIDNNDEPGTDEDVFGTTGVDLDIEYDGLTPVIRTQAPLGAGATHTIRFTIADALDSLLDSGVFLARLQGSTQVVSGPTTDLPQSGVIQFDPASYVVNETAGLATLTLVRELGSSGLVTVDLFTTNGEATAGLDYTALPLTTVTFADTETSKTVTIPILDDPFAEGDEDFTVTLTNPTNAAAIGINTQATVVIDDNELGVEFLQPEFVFSEGTDTVNAEITVILTSPAPTPVTVDFATITGGSATPNVDYTPVSGSLTFAPNETSRTITIPILDDFLVEPGAPSGETITVSLSNASLPVIIGLVNPAVVRIIDLDRPPAVLDAQFVTNERFINGVALRYSEAMTEPLVEDLRNYDLFLRKESKRLGGSATRTRMNLVSAVYEPTSRTITLTSAKPLKENKVYEVVANTTRFEGVESILGEKLDGNYDNIAGDDFTGYLSRATKITYFDANGDKVGLSLKGPGRMELFRDVERNARILRMINTSQDTILNGTFDPVELTDNRADIDFLLTGTGFRNRTPQPPFQIKRTINGLQIPNT